MSGQDKTVEIRSSESSESPGYDPVKQSSCACLYIAIALVVVGIIILIILCCDCNGKDNLLAYPSRGHLTIDEQRDHKYNTMLAAGSNAGTDGMLGGFASNNINEVSVMPNNMDRPCACYGK